MSLPVRFVRFLLPLCICCCFSSRASGQFQADRGLTIAEGLSQGMVFDIVQDREGFLWMGTKNGLNRYDGYDFKVFLPDAANPYSIPDNQVTAVFIDSQGRLWVGTTNRGVALFDQATHRFYRCALQDPRNASAGAISAGAEVTRIAEAPDGSIWVGTRACKLFKIELPKLLKFQFPSVPDFTEQVKISTVYPPENAFNNRDIGQIFRSVTGQMWVSIGERLYRLDYAGNRLIPVTITPSSNLPILSIQEDSGKNLLVSKANHVFCITPDNQLKTHFFMPHPVEKGAIIIDSHANVWARVGGKVVQCRYSDLRPDFFNGKPVMQLRQNEFFTKILIDRQGTTWLATNGYGVRRRSPDQTHFANYLQEYSLLHIYEDRRGRVLFWDYGDVYLLDKQTGTKSRTGILSEFGERKKGNLIADSRSGHWMIMQKQLGRTEVVLVKLDDDLKKLREYDLKMNGDWTSMRLLQDHSGYIWITCTQKELLRFNPATGNFTAHSYAALPAMRNVDAGASAIYEDGQGTIWVGTRTGLLKTTADGDGVRFSAVDFEGSLRDNLLANHVNALLDDPVQPLRYLWIGTWGGLIRLDKTTGKSKHFTIHDGLGDNTVAGILADDWGNLWISTFRGLSKLDIRTGVFSNYSSQDGIASDEFNRGCYFRNNRHELLFGGISGLTIFKPAKSWKTEKAPFVHIVGFRVHNQPITPVDSGGILSRDITELPAILLAHDQNVLLFQFATLNLRNSSKNRYRYQLTGVDKHWVDAGNNRFASYSKLPPGEYTLKVIASPDGSVWSERATELHFAIAPPWFQTWWAYSIYFLCAAGIGYLFYHSQIRRVRLAQRLAYEQKAAEQLLEMDRMKTKFFINISHEFRTPLTLLAGPLDDLGKKYPGEEMIPTMQRISSRLVALISQLLDIGRLDAGQMPLRPTAGDLALHMQMLASTFIAHAEKRGILFSINQNTSSVPAVFDYDKIDKIVTNLISNALKFTPAGGSVLFVVDYDLAGKQCRITVSDSGIGIELENLHRVFDRFYQVDMGTAIVNGGVGIGLSLVKELVDLLGGTLAVESRINEGTTFEIRLPLVPAERNELQQTLTVRPAPAGYTGMLSETDTTITTPPTENNGTEALMLIVEDNVDLSNYLVSIFQAHYRIITASNGLEGIEKALEIIPSIVISDVMMPGADGYQLCESLKSNEKTCHIPIIMLTAKSEQRDRIKGLELGADDYLTKPFDPTEIKTRVHNLMLVRQRLREFYSTPGIDLTSHGLKVEPLDQRFLKKAKEIVTQNIQNPTFDIDQFSAALHMTPAQLRRKLKAVTGMTPVDFNRSVKLHFAAALLSQKADSVSNIAYLSGFENLSYFSKSFRELFGMSPSEYVEGAPKTPVSIHKSDS